MASRLGPEQILSETDHGDDTQRRFRYQAAYAAIVALDLLRDDSEFDHLYCEHHEDILVCRRDGSFVGYQVKTRENGHPPLKTGDEPVISSLKAFVRLELEFPGSFSHFCIAASCGFWDEGLVDYGNLNYVLGLSITADESAEPPRPLGRLIDKLIVVPKSTTKLVLDVLRKTRVQKSPGLDDIESCLLDLVGEVPGVSNAPVSGVRRVASILIGKMLEAASLRTDSPRRGYLMLLADPHRALTDAIIRGKLITRETMRGILRDASTDEVLLRTSDTLSLANLPRGTRILEKKMREGRISYGSFRLARDHKASVESFLIRYLEKYGPEKARDMYQHLRVLVNTECQESRDFFLQGAEPFGPRMLQDVRSRLRQRHSDLGPAALFGCYYEHLMGMAAVLTEECEVWWSKEFDIEEADL